MALRPVWRGHLRLALVSCPVALLAQHEGGDLRFHMINPKTGNRIRMMTVDAETDEELQRRDLVKGYEFRKDQYLLLTDEDFDSVKVESSLGDDDREVRRGRTRSTRSTTPAATTSRRMATPGAMSMPCSARRSPRPAAWRWRAWSIGQRERTIALRAMAGGLVAHTLDEQRDINDARRSWVTREAQDRSGDGAAGEATDRPADGEYDPTDLEDRYETRLRAMIDAKLKGEGIDVSEPASRTAAT